MIHRAVRMLPAGVGLILAGALLFLLLGRVERTVEAGGEVRVERYQVVRPQVAGLVSGVFVEPGETVARGQVLLDLKDYESLRDLITIRQSLNEARARLEKAQVERRLLGEDVQPLEIRRQDAELGQSSIEAALSTSRVREAEIQLQGARDRLAKARKLSELGLVSSQDLEQAVQQEQIEQQRLAQSRLEERAARLRRPALDNDRELLKGEQHRALSALDADIGSFEDQVAQWTAQLRELEKLMRLRTIRAEMDGVVTGAPMRSLLGRSVQAGEDLFNIIDVTSISFVTRVPEQAIVRVRAGQAAYVEIAGLPKQRFDIFEGEVGTVYQEPEPKVGESTILYPVRIRLETPWITLTEGGRFYLRSGMQGVARIAYRRNVPIFDALWDELSGRSEVSTGGRKVAGLP
ncbi:MAG TPA: efflux RND transporter periplasmic adaptor subunit [Thermoanaerobaculia bacterium]|jgi:multidrug resistance efflux pump|nr:efflux RND transporter periplasmic adaptor subunit [Thermoanaerobaculia bacterium]